MENITIQIDLANGERPSDVFLRTLDSENELDGSDLVTLLREEYNDLNSVVWNIIVSWSTNRHRNPELFDKKLNLHLYYEFIKAGYKTPYTQQQLDEEWRAYSKNT